MERNDFLHKRRHKRNIQAEVEKDKNMFKLSMRSLTFSFFPEEACEFIDH